MRNQEIENLRKDMNQLQEMTIKFWEALMSGKTDLVTAHLPNGAETAALNFPHKSDLLTLYGSVAGKDKAEKLEKQLEKIKQAHKKKRA